MDLEQSQIYERLTADNSVLLLVDHRSLVA